MTTMVSLRLSAEQQQRLASVAERSGLSRSEWLRMAIERQLDASEASADPHAIYCEVMAPLADRPGSGRRDAARRHSEVLKQKLHASGRR